MTHLNKVVTLPTTEERMKYYDEHDLDPLQIAATLSSLLVSENGKLGDMVILGNFLGKPYMRASIGINHVEMSRMLSVSSNILLGKQPDARTIRESDMQRALDAVWDCWTKGGSLKLASELVRPLVTRRTTGPEPDGSDPAGPR